MRIVTAEEVHELCAWPKLVDALAAAHRGPAPMVGRSELHHTAQNVRDTYFNLPAWQPGVAMGTKIVTVFPSNPDKGLLPAVQAVYALFDGQDGQPLLLIDGTALTYRKTAADFSARIETPVATRRGGSIDRRGRGTGAIPGRRPSRRAPGHSRSARLEPAI